MVEQAPDYVEEWLDKYGSVRHYYPGELLTAVVDANALLSCIDNQTRRGWETKTIQAAKAGVWIIYAAEEVREEVYRDLEKFVRPSGPSLDQLVHCFETEYLPHILWVSVERTGVADARVDEVAAIHHADVPTAILASLISASPVLSEDHSLVNPGYANQDWRQTSKFAVLIVAGKDQRRSVSMTVALPVRGVGLLGKSVANALDIPPWLLALATVCLGAYILRTPERRKAFGEKVVPVFVEVLKSVSDEYQEGGRLERSGLTGVIDASYFSDAIPTPKESVARVLASRPEPLLAREIAEKVEERPGWEPLTLSEVRAILGDSPEFVRSSRYRWALGRRVLPRTESDPLRIDSTGSLQHQLHQ